MIRLYPKLCSDQLDDARFVSAENIDINPPLCEPLDKLLSSGSKSTNWTKDSSGFPIGHYIA